MSAQSSADGSVAPSPEAAPVDSMDVDEKVGILVANSFQAYSSVDSADYERRRC